VETGALTNVSDTGPIAVERAADSRPPFTILRQRFAVPLAIVAVAVAVAPHASGALALKFVLWISFAICALSLNFLWGRAGIFSFGQNALFGVGAYTYAIISLNVFPETGETMTALVGAGLVAAIAAAALGYFLFYARLGDVYLSIVTLAVTLIIYTILASTAGPEYRIGQAYLGGFNGIPSLPSIALPRIFGLEGEFSIRQMLIFAIVLAGVVYIVLDMLVVGRLGLKIAGLRSNELRMELLGYDVRRLKLLVFTIGGGIAGVGGGLFAAWGTFVNPSVFSLAQAATVVVWAMVGGRGSLFGAFVGVFLVQFTADAADLVVSEQTPLIVGLLLIAVVELMPDGVVPTLARFVPSRAAAARRTLPTVRRTARHGEGSSDRPRGRLEVDEIAKHFGGVRVLRDVSASFGDGPIQAIIGPNGAGKSTFFNILTGRIRPDAGMIRLNGSDVSGEPPHSRCRNGLGIKMQVPSVFQDLTVRENLSLAIMGSSTPIDMSEALQRVGLQNRIEDLAGSLSHGEQQWLEIALVIAQNPSVILLDEPGAGMGDEDKRRTIALIHELSAQHTLIVVEHDMSFIRALHAPVLMLHQGVVFRSGSFDELVRDDEVIHAYLGRRSHATA